MKNLFLTSLLSILSPLLMAQLFHQPQHFPDLHPDSVMRQDPRFAHMMYEPGEVIVRFEDDAVVSVFKSNGIARVGIESIDKIFEEFEVNEVKQLFKNYKRSNVKKFVTAYNGQIIEVPDLHNIFHVKYKGDHGSVSKLIEQLSNEKKIIYAEPNYIYTIANRNVTNGNEHAAILNDEVACYVEDIYRNPKNGIILPNDPLFSQQGYISDIRADSAWSVTTGDTTAVIAILDTGIDWLHPDLVNKIWINPNEQSDYIDNDGNGYVDDIRGWDFVNNDNNPLDDNGHGTPVAGIAGAESNNGIGIAGVSWNAKLMPVKVLNSHGYGNSADVALGIQYAAANGATIINMSFGSYYPSVAIENALVNAYLTSDLVAACGNDGLSIYEYTTPPFTATAYPAAFPVVLGVQADAAFSNFDPDGPIYSQYSTGLNYELKAPGSAMSTFLNGSYRSFSGTSMASPMVAGAVALYRAAHPDRNKEELWGDLIHFSQNIININQSITNENRFPILDLKEFSLSDTLTGNDGDGFYDAGETLLLFVTIRNSFGYADSVFVKLQHNIYENPDDVDFLVDSVFLGSMSTFAARNNNTTPLQILINPLVNNDKLITIDLLMKNAGDTATYAQPIQFRVYNGTDISGLITQDTTLTPDKLWLFNASTRIEPGVTMTVLPGTHIEINAGVDNRGFIDCTGTSDSLIYLKGAFGGNVLYDYADIDLRGASVGATEFRNTNVYNVKNLSANIFYKSRFSNGNQSDFNVDSVINSSISSSYISHIFQTRLFNSVYYNNVLYMSDIHVAEKSYFSNLKSINVHVYPNRPEYWQNQFLLKVNEYNINNYSNNTFSLKGPYGIFVKTEGSVSSIIMPENYWGSTDEDKIAEKYYDFWNDASLPFLIYEPKLEAPHPETPGHVWKVLVNGADAQDEYVEPVGPGPQCFDVYFNRPMDIAYPPSITFGVRFPYMQHTVSDSVSWSADSTIFTAWKTFHIYTGDGINRIRVANARDTAGWEIPVEDGRFEFLIDAAGSASIDFTATPGIGKVDLEWHEPDDLPTLLGYNMYRFHHLTDTTFSDTLLVNNALIIDTMFTDFNVVPQQLYYYMYKIVRTDFVESDFSQVVNATVLSATIGDANGDMSVNILDITSIVSYILSGNPQPFIFDAADVNADDQINLLDVIGVVNIIMNGSKSGLISQPGHIYLKPDEVELSSDGTLAGIQFKLVGNNIAALELKSQLKGFEFVRYISGDTLTGMLFNMHNNSIPQGRVKLFEIKQHPGTLGWGEVFGGNTSGRYVAIFKDEDLLPVDHRYGFSVHPNPAKDFMFTDIQLTSTGEVSLLLYDMYGRRIILKDKAILESGRHHFRFDKQQLSLVKGLYILQLHVRPIDKSELPFRKELKLVVM